MTRITNLNTLKAMSKAGLITLHEETAKYKYIKDGNHKFIYKNEAYKTIYLDGCFCPFIYKLKP
jgi:hypothetical protein